MDYNDYISMNYSKNEDKPKKKEPNHTPFYGWWTAEGDTIEANEVYEDDKIQYFISSEIRCPEGFQIKYDNGEYHERNNDDSKTSLRAEYKRKGMKCFEPTKGNCVGSITELEEDEHFQSELKKVKEMNKKIKPKISSSSDKIKFYKEYPFPKKTFQLYNEYLTTPPCSYCQQKHSLEQCEVYSKIDKKCILCNSNLHNASECLLNDASSQKAIKFCFKCGKFGHLYCLSLPIKEHIFLGNSIDPENSDIDRSSIELHTFHNSALLTDAKPSVLIHNKNFYDSDDDFII